MIIQEFICVQCKGSGEEHQEINPAIKVFCCRMCGGSGKADWVQHVVCRLDDLKENSIKVSDRRRIR